MKQIDSLPSENNSRSRKKLSIVKLLLWNEEIEKTKILFQGKRERKMRGDNREASAGTYLEMRWEKNVAIDRRDRKSLRKIPV